MSQDNPDTIVMEELPHWAATQVEDVFLPSVRVQLSWRDIEDAAAHGAIVPSEAHSLWATWAMPGAPTRVVNARAGSDDAAFSKAGGSAQGVDSQYLEMPSLARDRGSHGGLAGVAWLVAGGVLGGLLAYLVLA